MPDITIKATVDYETTQPYKIELTRSQKGTYGWTITIHAFTVGQAIQNLTHLDNQLAYTYAKPTPETREE